MSAPVYRLLITDTVIQFGDDWHNSILRAWVCSARAGRTVRPNQCYRRRCTPREVRLAKRWGIPLRADELLFNLDAQPGAR